MKIIPVIHALNESQAFENIETIKSAGLKQAFLISHGNLNWKELLSLSKKIKEKYTDFWIGCNFLDLPSETTFLTLKEEIHNLNGLWIDDSFQGTNTEKADKLKNDWINSEYKGIYFAGVAFKGCKQPNSIEEATKSAQTAMNVITTTGPATGIAPSPEKVLRMKDVAGKTPLGLASGVSESNIRNFIHTVEYFLVASSIEDKFGNISKEKLTKLIQKASL